MIAHGQLEYVTKPLVEIGMFNPKSGDDKDIIVINFYVKEEEALKGVEDFIEYIPLNTFISVSTSNHMDEDGYYLIYVELEKTEKLFDDFKFLLKEFNNLSNFEEWTIQVYKRPAKKITMKELLNAE